MVRTRGRLVLAVMLLARAASAAAQWTATPRPPAGSSCSSSTPSAATTRHRLRSPRRDPRALRPAALRAMVRTGYPEIARSVSAVIDGSERGPGGRLYLLVRVRGANGQGLQACTRWSSNTAVANQRRRRPPRRERESLTVRVIEGATLRRGAPSVWSGPCRGPARTLVEERPAAPGRDERWGAWGPCRAPMSVRTTPRRCRRRRCPSSRRLASWAARAS